MTGEQGIASRADGVRMKPRGLSDYVHHAERFGSDGVLDAAARDLDEAELVELRRRLEGTDQVTCATPGCPVMFVPRRKGQRYHSDACRQKAHRIRRGQEPRVASVAGNGAPGEG